MRDVAILNLNNIAEEDLEKLKQHVLPFLNANKIALVIFSDSPQSAVASIGEKLGCQKQDIYSVRNEVPIEFTSNNRIVLKLGNSNIGLPELQDKSYIDFSQKTIEEIISQMTLDLYLIDGDKYEALASVDRYANISGTPYLPIDFDPNIKVDGLNRNFFYAGGYTNKNCCGVVFWIFDKDGNILLSERGSDKEQGSGKISPSSGHVQLFVRESLQEKMLENPLIGCLEEVGEEHGIHYEERIFPMLDDCFPRGVISRPGNSGEGCNMIVRHFALCVDDETKKEIKNNESKKIFFEPWEEAREKFSNPDSTSKKYVIFGGNEQEVIGQLDKFREKIKCLNELGPDSRWTTTTVGNINSERDFAFFASNNVAFNRVPDGYTDYKVKSYLSGILTDNGASPACVEHILARDSIPRQRVEEIIKKHSKGFPEITAQNLYQYADVDFGKVSPNLTALQSMVKELKVDDIESYLII